MSSWYRTLDAGIWGDEKFRNLSRPTPSAQFLWIYLLTGEHTDGLPGLYRIGEAALAEALGWSLNALREKLEELTSLDMVLADIKARVIYLPNGLRYQFPDNPNHIKGLGKSFRRIPECDLKDTWFKQLKEIAREFGETYVEAINEGYTVSHTVRHRVSPPNPHPNPNNYEGDYGNKAFSPPGPQTDIPFAQIVGLLNDQSGKRFRHGTEATKRHIRARWNEGHRLEDFQRVIKAKCAEWRGTEMEKYLRPQTLFGPKFEGYANERASNPGGTDSQYPEMDQLMEQDDER